MQSCSNTTRPLGTLEPVEGDKTVNEVRAKTIETKETGRKLNVFNKKKSSQSSAFCLLGGGVVLEHGMWL